MECSYFLYESMMARAGHLPGVEIMLIRGPCLCQMQGPTLDFALRHSNAMLNG